MANYTFYRPSVIGNSYYYKRHYLGWNVFVVCIYWNWVDKVTGDTLRFDWRFWRCLDCPPFLRLPGAMPLPNSRAWIDLWSYPLNLSSPHFCCSWKVFQAKSEFSFSIEVALLRPQDLESSKLAIFLYYDYFLQVVLEKRYFQKLIGLAEHWSCCRKMDFYLERQGLMVVLVGIEL